MPNRRPGLESLQGLLHSAVQQVCRSRSSVGCCGVANQQLLDCTLPTKSGTQIRRLTSLASFATNYRSLQGEISERGGLIENASLGMNEINLLELILAKSVGKGSGLSKCSQLSYRHREKIK